MDWQLAQAYLAICLSALLPIVTGSLDSIRPPRAVRRARRRSARLEESSSDDDADVERLTATDAALFPIVGSIALVGLYLAYRYVTFLDHLLSFYFGAIGLAGVARVREAHPQEASARSHASQMGGRLCKGVMGWTKWARFSKYDFRLSRDGNLDLFHLRFTAIDVAAASVAVGVIVTNSLFRHWITNNLVALSIGFNAIGLLKIDSFKTGMLMLALLFVYDVWWCAHLPKARVIAETSQGLRHRGHGAHARHGFPTSTPRAVPRSLSPRKSMVRSRLPGLKTCRLRPKPLRCSAWAISYFPVHCTRIRDVASLRRRTGIFIALCARFDYARTLDRVEGKPPLPIQAKQRPYFYAALASCALLSYVPASPERGPDIAGLATTISVMHLWDHAQPALLYLSPACIFSVVTTAVLRGELGVMWRYDDAELDERDKREAAELKASPSASKKDLLPPAPDSTTEIQPPKSVLASTEEEVPSDADDEMTSAGEASEVRRRRSRRKAG
jgi:minor histocompatibility antigen H13